MNKSDVLLKIAKQIENCDDCKKDKIGMAVPGEGNPDGPVKYLPSYGTPKMSDIKHGKNI